MNKNNSKSCLNKVKVAYFPLRQFQRHHVDTIVGLHAMMCFAYQRQVFDYADSSSSLAAPTYNSCFLFVEFSLCFHLKITLIFFFVWFLKSAFYAIIKLQVFISTSLVDLIDFTFNFFSYFFHYEKILNSLFKSNFALDFYHSAYMQKNYDRQPMKNREKFFFVSQTDHNQQ